MKKKNTQKKESDKLTIEKILGIRKMTISQCQELAKDIGFDCIEFYLVGPEGRKKAKWLDAYMGMLKIDGCEGFVMVKDLIFANDLWCENLVKCENGLS